ncbi:MULTISPECIES: glycosyl hydrolase 108 family protein, partial [unclassified Microcoleus]|uniref:glycosyl hydrolase 108 family protein n=1 Tax=unclassified Microcoleus TaxID=2642155 RepID=UPI002FCEE8D6
IILMIDKKVILGSRVFILIAKVTRSPSPTPQVNNPSGFTPVVFTRSVGVDTNYGIRLRTDTRLDAPGEIVTYDSQIEFDGWKYGEPVQDRTVANGQMDVMWYRIKDTNYWIPSAFIIGYPPGYQPPVSSGGNTGNTGSGNNNNTLPVQPADFTKALAFNLRWEGEYSNHPSDPGGATNKGITQNTYNGYRSSKGLSTQDVRGITEGEVQDIYYTNYWIASGSDQLTSRLAMVNFDTAVNMGVGAASGLLQQARQSANGDEMSVVRRYLDLREARYRAIVASNPSMGVFLQGWLNRLNSLRAQVGATGGSSNNNNGGNNNTGGSLGQLGYVGIGVTPIDDSSDNRHPKNSLELGLESLSWTKQRLEEFDRLIEYRNQFELPLSSDLDDLLFRKFATRPGTGKEFNYAEYLQLKAVNSLLNGAIDYTTQTDDLIEDYIDSIVDSEDYDTADKLYSLKQSWESGRKQAQETINQKSKTPWGSIILDSFAELGRIFENSAKGAFYGISAYLRIRALVNGGPLAKLSSYYSTEDGWQRLENTRISEDTGKLVDVLGWILSDKWGDLQKAIDINKSENFSNLGIVVSAIAGDIMGWIEQYRLNGVAGLIGDFKSISDEIKKIVEFDKLGACHFCDEYKYS